MNGARTSRLAPRVSISGWRADGRSGRSRQARRSREPTRRRHSIHAGSRPEFLESSHAPSAVAREFLAALGARVGRAVAAGPAPDRLIVVVDNLDALPPAAVVSWIDAAQSAIGPGCIGLLAFDPGRLVATLGGPREARRRLANGCRSRSTCRPARTPTANL